MHLLNNKVFQTHIKAEVASRYIVWYVTSCSLAYYDVSEEYPEGIKLLYNFGRCRPDCTVPHFRKVTFTADAVRKPNSGFVDETSTLLCSDSLKWA